MPTRLLDAPGDPVPVLRAHRLECLQDHQGQRALPDVCLVAHISLLQANAIDSSTTLAIEEANASGRMACGPRIVRDHANRRTVVMQLAQQPLDRLAPRSPDCPSARPPGAS